MTSYKNNPKVFFDASVIFSAIYSHLGASYELCPFVRNGKIIGFTTQTVIEEVIDNIGKLKRLNKESIRQFIKQYKFIVREAITVDEIKPYIGIVEKKDAHVLAGAILTHTDYLVTLDKKHIDNTAIKSKISNLKITSPGELLLLIKSPSRPAL